MPIITMSSIRIIRRFAFYALSFEHKKEGFNLEQWLFNYLAMFEDIEGDEIDSENIINEFGREYAESLYKQWQGYPFGSDEDDDDHMLALFALCQQFTNEFGQR